MPPVIVAKDLCKRYPGFPPVLRGVSISVEPGELVAIMGPSGCGKSTMLHVLGMLHAPDSGSLEILGTDVLVFDREQTAAFRRGNMGFVMQSSNLFEHSTVFENVEFPLIYEKVPSEERWERVIRALELVNLASRVQYRSNRLSGGEQQRVAIARAMVNNPRVLLADEPTGALDARTSRVVMENFRTLCHSGGVAMIMVTHDPRMAEYCDTIYTLDEGLLTCRRQDRSFMEKAFSARGHLLEGPPKVMRAACIMEKFPEPAAVAVERDILRLHRAGILSRVYAGGGFSSLSGGEQYALPLPVQRVRWWLFFSAVAAGFSKKNVSSLGLLRGTLPLRNLSIGAFFARWRYLLCGALMADWARNSGVDFFYAPGGTGASGIAWAASRMAGIPFAFYARLRDMSENPKALGIKVREALFVRCDTEKTYEMLKTRFPGFAGKFVLLRDCLTLSLPPAEEAAAPEPHRKPCILAAGSLVPEKGLPDILRACAGLKALGVPFELKIAGSGRQIWKLRYLIWRLGLRGRVTLLGHVPHDRMPEYLQAADIFVAGGYASRDFPGELPTALQEAMLFGCAVVATDLPGQAEVLQHEETALLVPQRNPEGMTQALRRLLEHPDLAEKLGSAAQQAALKLFGNEPECPELAELFLRARRSSEQPESKGH